MNEQTTSLDELVERAHSELASGYLDAMKGAVGPIMSTLNEMESEIQRREEELEALRRLRTAARRIVASLAPQAAPKNGTKKRGQRATRGISPESLEALRAFIEEHGDDWPDGFMTPDVVRHAEWNGVGAAAVRIGLDTLASEGLIRLDRIGRSPTQETGREGRIYKVNQR